MKILVSGFRLHSWYQVGLAGWRLVGAILLLNFSFITGAFAQNKIWDKTIGGNSTDYLQSIRQTKDGGYLLGGQSYSSRSWEKSEDNKGGSDYWVVKIQSDGTKAWDRTIGGNSEDYLRASFQTSDGGYILGGSSYSGKSTDKSGNNKGGQDYWVIKLNSKGEKVWDKTVGGNNDDVLQSLVQTQDGGFVLFGYSSSGFSGDKSQASNGNHDYWIVKLKADGSKAWDKSYGGNNQDIATSILQTSNGGFILAGHSSSNISGDKSQDSKGNEDYWIMKLNSEGDKEWDRTFGGNNSDYLASIQQTNDSGFLLGGTSNSGISGDKSQNSKGNNDYWVVKIKADGSKEWDSTIGGNSDDNLSSAQQTPDGSYILGGSSYSGISGNKTQASKGSGDYWMAKLSPDGTYAWDKTIGANSEDNLISLLQTQDGNFLLGGQSYSQKSGDKSEDSRDYSHDYWIVKVDNSGTNLNQLISFAPFTYKTLGDPPITLSANINTGLPITFTVESGPATVTNGNILTLTGVGTVIVKAAQLGNGIYQPVSATRSFVVEPASKVDKQWIKTLGGNATDRLTSIQQTSDKGYILGGSSGSGKSGNKSQASKGGLDYWIVKLNADGSPEWDKTYGGGGTDNLASVQQTSDGGYILGGYSSSGKSGDKSQASQGSLDYWIVKLKADGTKEWDKAFGGKNQDWLTSLEQTSDGGYILGGYSVSGIGADKTEDYRGSSDYWVIKLKSDGTKEWDKTVGGRYEDVLSSLQQTNEGGYILGGTSNSSIGGEKSQARIGNNDFWIVKLKANGSKDWDKTLGGSDEDYLASLEQTSDEGYILGGHSYSSVSGDKSQKLKGGYDYWVLKLRADGTKEWDKTLGGNESEALTIVHQTNDGGYILGGNSYSAVSGDKTQISRGASNDYWVIKLKADGTKAWDKTLGGNNNDQLAAIQETSDGEYLVGGTSNSGISGDKSDSGKGGEDFWLVKLKEDVDLNTVWEYRFGGSSDDNLTSLIKTFDGGYLAAGYTTSGSSGDKSQPSRGERDYWIVKTDKNGQKQWDKRYGGGGDDYLNRVLQTQDGGYLLTGSSLSNKSGDKTEESQGSRDFWVVKVNKQGNKEWDKTLGGSGNDELQKAIQLATGEYVLGGTSNSPVSGDKSQAAQGGTDYWLVKISKTGTKLWDKRFGGSLNETLGSFTQTQDNGFFLGGSSESGNNGDKTQAGQGSTDYWVVKTDQEGNLLWEQTYGGSGADEAYSVGRGQGNHLFITGTSNSGKTGDKSQDSQGGKDYWLIKLDEKGKLIWDRTFGGSKDEELRASTFTHEDQYVLAGTSYSPADGDKTQASQGSGDYWVVQVNEDGQLVADQRYGGSGLDELRSVFQTKDGGLLLGGRSDSGVSGDRSQPSQGRMDYWLVKVAPLTSTLTANRQMTQSVKAAPETELKVLSAFPNPITEQLTVHFTLPQTQMATVKVYDSQGKVVAVLFQDQAQAHQKYQVKWQAHNQAAGMYFLQLQTPTNRLQEKLILAK